MEALVALTLFALGLLAWLATAWRVAWLDSRTRADAHLAASADRWRERMAALPCESVADGAHLEGHIRVRWSVQRVDGRHLVAIHLAQPHGTGWRTVERHLVRHCVEGS